MATWEQWNRVQGKPTAGQGTGGSALGFLSHLDQLPKSCNNLEMAVPDIKALNKLKHSSYFFGEPRFRNPFTSRDWFLDQKHGILRLHSRLNESDSGDGAQKSPLNKPSRER